MTRPTPNVRVVHETNPSKYYPAIFALSAECKITLKGTYRNSVVKESIRSRVSERRPLRAIFENALRDAAFRLQLLFVSGEVVVLAFAPWDARLLFYGLLRHRNAIIYHTSWPYWQIGRTPRTVGLLDGFLSRRWRRILLHENVTAVAVLEAPRAALAKFVPVPTTVIPHAVPDVFFAATTNRTERPQGSPLRVLFVGELSRKKGLEALLSQLQDCGSSELLLTIVGRGELEARCQEAVAANVSFRGAISDRIEMARIMGRNDVLIVPSQRTDSWEELFGIVIVEAMAAGMGVIASDHVGPRSILGRIEGAALFDETDVTGMFQKLLELAQDRDALLKFRLAHQVAARAYHESKVSSAWLAIIEAANRTVNEK